MTERRALKDGLGAAFRDKKGLTMVELVMAAAIFVVVAATALAFFMFTNDIFNMTAGKSDKQNNARIMLIYITQQMQSANRADLLSAKPGSFNPNSEYFYAENGYLKHYENGNVTSINLESLDNLNIGFARQNSNVVINITIDFEGLANAYSRQLFLSNATEADAGTGTSGACIEFNTQ